MGDGLGTATASEIAQGRAAQAEPAELGESVRHAAAEHGRRNAFLTRCGSVPALVAVPDAHSPLVPAPAPGASAAASIAPSDVRLTGLMARPEFVRLVPPLALADGPAAPADALDAAVSFDLLWDASFELARATPSAQARELMRLAQGKTLGPAEQKVLCDCLAADGLFVLQGTVPPADLANLVTLNLEVAYHLVLSLVGRPQAAPFLAQLLSMEVTLQAIELVNKLARVVALPDEFLSLFIAHCIASCYRKEDTQNRHRLVRVVCVFLQALIRNEVVAVRGVFHEIEAFCIEFAKMREAAGLFRLLRSLDEAQNS